VFANPEFYYRDIRFIRWFYGSRNPDIFTRQLHTQYAEGIFRHKYYTVTLKSRPKLRVTQGHWKRNHWIDHTRFSSSRVIWRWILSWPWNVGYRSLKVIDSGTIWKLGYSFLFAVNSNYTHIFSHFRDIQRQAMTWPWNLGLESFKVIQNGAVLQTMYDFLLVRHCNYSSILYHLRVFDVEYYLDLEISLRGHSRSLKLVPFESLGAVSYSSSIVTMAVCSRLWDI